MSKDTKIVEEYTDAPVDTDIETKEWKQRDEELRGWDEAQAKELAREEGIELTQEHLDVLRTLRLHYLENGPADTARELEELLADKFAEQGGRKYLFRLFPEGPVNQASRLAGLPLPRHSEDEGFGTAR